MWTDEASVSVNSTTNDFIDVSYEDTEQRKLFRATFVHAPATFQERKQTWKQLQQIYALNTLPWVCIGDFNGTLYHWEKVGKKDSELYRLTAFRDFLNACRSTDMESKGCAFTWANNSEGEEFVKKRLDRAAWNFEWRILFPKAEAFALPAIGRS